MKLSDFKLTVADFGTFGRDLQRPECVWVDHDGIWTSDMRGGVAHVAKDGEAKVLGTGIGETNGFSRRPDGSFVVAGIGDGGLHLVASDGKTRTLVNSFGGKPLGAVNYACADGLDRIWLSVMTRALPWHAALTTTKVDGYILRVDGDGARCEIVADGLDLTNEVKVSPDGRHLYSVETFGARVVRFARRPDGSLGAKEVVASLDRDVFPDGITFDRFGNLWITAINQNGLFAMDRRGDVHIVFRDMNKEAVKIAADGVAQRNGVVDQLAACAQGPIPLATSIGFGGPDGRTAYVGSVAQSHLATFRLPETLE
ncbi:MAG TPA: SMP-30/gluconolactonase/LRE family protein [Rhizomicrobium sp.]|nr:SMP-30/gluconolactonase/LRE family protein [Rhizomicrobium sp.]